MEEDIRERERENVKAQIRFIKIFLWIEPTRFVEEEVYKRLGFLEEAPNHSLLIV